MPEDAVLHDAPKGTRVTIASMTGFARRQGALDDFLWAWELKCVNGRNLEVRCRLPAGLDTLDGFVRAACAERLKRGNLSVMLTVDDKQAVPTFRVNEAALEQIGRLLEGLKGRIDADPPRLDGERGAIDRARAAERAQHDRTVELSSARIGDIPRISRRAVEVNSSKIGIGIIQRMNTGRQ